MAVLNTMKRVFALSRRLLKNNKDYSVDRVGAILSMNRALLGEVFPALRSARIAWDDEKICVFFYYDGEISEDDHESAECVATEVIADYPDYTIEVNILRWDYPNSLPQNEGILVYKRKEASP